MRPLVIAMFVLLAFAGCMDRDNEDVSPADTEPESDPTAEGPFRIEKNETPQENVTMGEHRFTMEAGELEFEHTLLRFALVARSNISYDADIVAAAGWYDHQDGCFVAALTPMKDGTAAGGAFVGGWAYENSYRTGISVAGTGTGTDPYGERVAATGDILSAGVRGQLAAGDHLIIDVGGRDASFLQEGTHTTTGSDAHPNDLNLTIDVTGDAAIVALPPTTIHCGVGPAQAEGTVHAKLPFLQEAAIEARLDHSSPDNATLIWLDEGLLDSKEVRVGFGDESFEDPERVVRSRSGAHDMSIFFGHSAEATPAGGWLMAEAYWPALQET